MDPRLKRAHDAVESASELTDDAPCSDAGDD